MSDLLGRLGTVVRSSREEQGLSVAELAARANLSTRFVTEIQAGRGNISVERLEGLARALGTTASRLLAAAEARDGQGRAVVSLLGVRGAGKSTIGHGLAKKLGVELVELDPLVELEAGLSLAEIFSIHGEETFHRLEVTALRRLLARSEGFVLATGGGIVENDEAWALLEANTVTVWLRASAAAHWNRVVSQGDARPMRGRPAARAELRRLLARREPLYRRARIRIDTERLGIAGSVRHIERNLKPGPGRSRAGAAKARP